MANDKLKKNTKEPDKTNEEKDLGKELLMTGCGCGCGCIVWIVGGVVLLTTLLA